MQVEAGQLRRWGPSRRRDAGKAFIVIADTVWGCLDRNNIFWACNGDGKKWFWARVIASESEVIDETG